LADNNTVHPLSFTKEGVEKHIEVKSISTKNDEQGFYISDTELQLGKNDNHRLAT
jgi:hypothetical protein